MTGWRSKHGNYAEEARSGGWLMAHYLTDLAMSVGLVLVLGWVVQSALGERVLDDALIAQNEVYAAISRFTPQNLLLDYLKTVDRMMRNVALSHAPGEGLVAVAGNAAITAAQLILDAVLAFPRILFSLYRGTDGVAGWIVLAGFGTAIGAVFVGLLMARVSLSRLLLAIILTPLAISAVFLMLQAFMVLMLNAFVWLTPLAPYAVAGPILCTLYWVVYPDADRGATAHVVRAVARMLEAQR